MADPSTVASSPPPDPASLYLSSPCDPLGAARHYLIATPEGPAADLIRALAWDLAAARYRIGVLEGEVRIGLLNQAPPGGGD